MLRHFPAVRGLCVSNSMTFVTHDLGIAEALAQCELSSFAARLRGKEGEQAVAMDPRWATDDWASVGRLHSLKLDLDRLADAEWAFVERFAGSLKHLDLRFSSFSGTTNPPSLSTTFPQLDSLRLHADAVEATHLLSLFSPFPLRTLELVVSKEEPQMFRTGSAFFAALEACTSTLRRLGISTTTTESYVLDPLADKRLRRFCRAKHIDFTSNNPYPAHFSDLTYTDFEAIDHARRVETDDIVGSINDVLEFGARRSAALRDTVDLEGAKELLERTRGLKGLQEVWRY